VSCDHREWREGPHIPRIYGTWYSVTCTACGAWRTMTTDNVTISVFYGARDQMFEVLWGTARRKVWVMIDGVGKRFRIYGFQTTPRKTISG
jgi:hypothetical protein